MGTAINKVVESHRSIILFICYTIKDTKIRVRAIHDKLPKYLKLLQNNFLIF